MKKTKLQWNPVEELQKSFEQWDDIYVNGCRDPFWSDGCNLNLVHNHIIFHKQEITETCEPQDYPAVYQRETPPEVPQGYMARSDKIRINAQKALDFYKADKNYLFLSSKADQLHPKDRKVTCIDNIINYVKGLDQAIASDDLISMRRHENPDNYIESFRQCTEQVKSLKPRDNEQLSLFFMPTDEPEDEPEEESQSMSF